MPIAGKDVVSTNGTNQSLPKLARGSTPRDFPLRAPLAAWAGLAGSNASPPRGKRRIGYTFGCTAL